MPGSPPLAGPFVYQPRAVLRGVSPLICRRLLGLTTAPRLAAVFSVEAVGEVIEASRAARGQLAAYELQGLGLPEIGRG